MKPTSLLIALLFCAAAHAADLPRDTTITRKKYVTQRINGSITLDGIPDELAWSAVEWGGDFVQWMPREGEKPYQQSGFKILYDDKFLYVAYRCFDREPDSIARRMSRRDEFPGDWIEINIDSYNDKLNAFSFTLSASGVRSDEFASNDGRNWDPSWNPIWFSKTHIDEQGWTGEAKIPFSQLRYGSERDKVWGLQVSRRIFRLEERSYWQYIPQNRGVWVSAFGELHGLKDIPMHRQVEIAPYITVQGDKYREQPGNPFATGFDKKLAAGVDGKAAVTNDLILDFTINPDFGQVEADPSQVRIDGFQSFFDEKRPFFIESRNIFNYQLTGSVAGGDYDADLLFYSRRIGSSPHGFPKLNAGEFVKQPQSTSILGAAKFSGKTRKGWSIGILESVTEREHASVDLNGNRRKELVEPVTNYFVGRLQKDIDGANTILGGIVTAVHREKGLNYLHSAAYTGGLDFLHYWKNKIWYVRGNLVFSHVEGSPEAILRTQTAFEHLFQRRNAPELTVDSQRRSLTGTSGTFRIGKSGGRAGKQGQVFRFETGFTWRSPELELNDIGFMLTTNEINHFTWAGLNYQKAFSIFRAARVNYNHWARWDFSGRHVYRAFNMNTSGTFRNNYNFFTGFTWVAFGISNNALRGGPALRRLPGFQHNIQISADSRRKVYGSANIFNFWGFEKSMRIVEPGASISVHPLDALRITLSASYGYNWRKQDQFVRNVYYNSQLRSIVGEVKQKTLRITGRVNYNVTPDLTIQYYGQPFITRPLYSRFAYVTDPLARKLEDRFTVFTPGQISSSNGAYIVDENMDGTPDYSFAKPDFNFVQFRSNLVVRWEYKAGSELYLVWSRSNTADAFAELDTPIAGSLFDHAFSGDQARNIFLLKWTYRFLR
ncbi:MAG TPA: DUF5916 domain-containing protein [Chitinophagaceae bacterium]|nr:DUF5916 domain-containing protein [Chitinophagaceae bacterium]